MNRAGHVHSREPGCMKHGLRQQHGKNHRGQALQHHAGRSVLSPDDGLDKKRGAAHQHRVGPRQLAQGQDDEDESHVRVVG